MENVKNRPCQGGEASSERRSVRAMQGKIGGGLLGVPQSNEPIDTETSAMAMQLEISPGELDLMESTRVAHCRSASRLATGDLPRIAKPHQYANADYNQTISPLYSSS